MADASMIHAFQIPDTWEYSPQNWCECPKEDWQDDDLAHWGLAKVHMAVGTICTICQSLSGDDTRKWLVNHEHCGLCNKLTQIS